MMATKATRESVLSLISNFLGVKNDQLTEDLDITPASDDIAMQCVMTFGLPLILNVPVTVGDIVSQLVEQQEGKDRHQEKLANH